MSILVVAAVVLQSLFGTVAGAGAICLGGGHEHPEEAVSKSCELDCGHASGRAPFPSMVEESHNDCSCVDIDFSISELLTALTRVGSTSTPPPLLVTSEVMLVGHCDWGPTRFLRPVPSWFDPGGTQRVTHLATTRLIV